MPSSVVRSIAGGSAEGSVGPDFCYPILRMTMGPRASPWCEARKLGGSGGYRAIDRWARVPHALPSQGPAPGTFPPVERHRDPLASPRLSVVTTDGRTANRLAEAAVEADATAGVAGDLASLWQDLMDRRLNLSSAGGGPWRKFVLPGPSRSRARSRVH